MIFTTRALTLLCALLLCTTAIAQDDPEAEPPPPPTETEEGPTPETEEEEEEDDDPIVIDEDGEISEEAEEEEDDDPIVIDEDGQIEGEEEEDDDDPIVLDEDGEETDPIVIDGEGDEEEEEDDDFGIGPILITDTELDLARLDGSAHKITEEELEEYEYDDAHQLLLSIPGVYVRQEDAFGLRPNIGLRGANSDRSKKVALMEDGILLGPAPYAAPAAYYFPLMTRMVGIGVFKGPSTLRYGPNTIGGAIVFESRSAPAEREGGIDLALGSFTDIRPSGKLHLYYGDSLSWGRFVVEGVNLESDGFKEIDGGGETGFSKSEFNVQGELNSNPEAETYHRLTLRLGFSRELSNETYLGLTDEDFKANPKRRYVASNKARMDWWRTKAQLAYRMDVGEDLSIKMALYRHDFDRAWRKLNRFADGPSLEEILADPSTGRRALFFDVLTGAQDTSSPGETLLIGTNARTYVSQGYQAEATWAKAEKTWSTELRLGLRLHHDDVNRNHTEEGFAMLGGTPIRDDSPLQTTTRNEGSARALATWMTNTTGIGDLFIAPGVRFELIQTRFINALDGSDVSAQQTVALPGLGLWYALTDELGLLAGVHRGFSPVSPGQPDDVEPETSINYELGTRYADPTTGTQAELVGFFNDYDNLTGECSFSAGCNEALIDQQFNAGQVLVYGVETMATHAFKLGKTGLSIPTRVAYTMTVTEFQSAFVSDNPQFGEVAEGDELPYVPTHQASAKAGLAGKGWSFSLSATFVDEMREIAGQGNPEPGEVTDRYVMVDGAAHLDLFEGAEAYLKVDNALGVQPIVARRPFGARPSKPFMLQLGARYTF